MSGERWIVRDTKCGNSQPFLGTRGWGFTVAAAGSYERREDADNALGSLAGCAQGRLVVRPVVPAGTKRARGAAQADADNVATMRAELEGLRATDAEMAAKLADATARAEKAEREAMELRNGGRIYVLETELRTERAKYEGTRELLGRVLTALGTPEGVDVVRHAGQVAYDRDKALRDLGELQRAIDVLTAHVARPAA